MLTRRIVKKLVTLWIVFPIHADLVRARVGGLAGRLLAGRKRRLLASLGGISAAALLLTSGHWLTAAILAALGIPLILIPIRRSGRRPCHLRDLPAQSQPH